MNTPGNNTQGAEIRLRFATVYQSSVTALTEGFSPWARWVEEKSEGRVEIITYADQSALTVAEVLDGVKRGVVDIGEFRIDMYPGRFTLNSVTELPLLLDYPSGRNSGAVANALYEKYPELQAEFEGVKFLCWVGGGAGQIFTSNKRVQTIEDMEGLVFSVSGAYSSAVIRELSATPESLSPGEDYGALERDFTDGIVGDYVFIKDVGLDNLLNYTTEVGCLVTNLDAYVMNLDTWNSLPPDIQTLFSGESIRGFSEVQGYIIDKREMQCRAYIEQVQQERGYPGIYILPADEKALWIEAIMPVREMWLRDAAAEVGEARARAILEDAITFARQYSYENYPRDFPEQTIEMWNLVNQ